MSGRPDELDEQITAYFGMLPAIRERHGSTWVLISKGELIATFADFAPAARYANEHYPKQQVLIRHTDEEPVFAPSLWRSAAVKHALTH